jgi:hypothetical protein
MNQLVVTWSVFKKLCGAAFFVPCGALLVVAAVWIVSSASHWFAIGVAAWLGYEGVNTIIGSLAGFAGFGDPSVSDTRMGATRATRNELRRAGLLKR